MTQEQERLIERLIADHNRIVQDAMDKFQVREMWEKGDTYYKNLQPAIPATVKSYTEVFLEGIRDIVKEL